jgi:2-iminobutanoate/2-iminopropanoate deaminase
MVAAAGQAGITPDGTVVDGVYEQTHQALSNVVAALAASGATADDIISVRVFLTEPSQFAAMNDAYVRFFEEPFPARTTVYVGLPPGLHVEIDAIALVQDSAE